MKAIVAEVSEMCEKDAAEVRSYYDAFWEKGPKQLSDWKKLNERITKGEQKVAVR